jgi:taurine dioxygenase
MIVRSLSDVGGVEVEGVDLSRPQSPEESRALAELYDREGLVVFRDQALTKQQVIGAAAPFGGAMINVPGAAIDPEVPGIIMLSTRGPSGDVLPDDDAALIGDLEWHTDQGFVTVPSRGKILYAVAVPEEGGLTGFIDGQLTWKQLPQALKRRVEGLHVIQSWDRADADRAKNIRYRVDGAKELASGRFPNVAYPIVMAHPHTGEKILNVPPMWAAGIVELPGAEGDALLAELVAFVKQERFQYWHRYRVGDALIWDNWRFLHAASGTPGRYVRTMWTVMVQGGPEVGYEIAA